MRRVISVWLPDWPIERLRRSRRRSGPGAGRASGAAPADRAPFALIQPDRGVLRLFALNRSAADQGLTAGQALTDARALIPDLTVQPAAPEADAKGLAWLADWCSRYTPWTNIDGTDGLWLDITGCAHLFGGEAGLIDDLVRRLTALGFTARPGLADTPGAAWAIAHYGTCTNTGPIAGPREQHQALAPLPVEALRLDIHNAVLLKRLGLKTIGLLCDLPRAALARRFRSPEEGEAVLTRLDQALGQRDEPLSPLYPVPAHSARLALAEPLLTAEGMEAVLDQLLATLCHDLTEDQKGARSLTLHAYRVDGEVSRIAIAMGRPARDPRHMKRLFNERLDTIDLGFGVDTALLTADLVEPLLPRQIALHARDRRVSGEAVDQLIDRLANRLGDPHVRRLQLYESHIPERAQRRRPAGQTIAPWPPSTRPRPCRLLSRPEPIEVIAEIPESPPMQFTWRRVSRRVLRADGPERIAPEWWRLIGSSRQERVRDYYRVEDQDGRRYWLYREGLYQQAGSTGTPAWFLHGVFG